LASLFSCRKDPAIPGDLLSQPVYDPQPYVLQSPDWFDVNPIVDAENPMTQQGVLLGRKLFYDPILSGDSTQSCASCHKQSLAFTDGLTFSTGIDGIQGNRNAMAIINLAYVDRGFFWDGSALTLEEQALEPVPNPIEMHLIWSEAVERLQRNKSYSHDFYSAFGLEAFDSTHVAKALTQFMKTLQSHDAKIDQVLQNFPEGTDPELLDDYLFSTDQFTDRERRGANIYLTEKGDCFHCHGIPRMTNNDFHDNGLELSLEDLESRSTITGNPLDRGRFRSPTLRNIALTAPYMHDGRFSTLRKVLEHYSVGLTQSRPIDDLMKNAAQGGLRLTNEELLDLEAFLHTFTDSSFIKNPAYSNPFLP